MQMKRNNIVTIGIVGGGIVLLIMVFGSMWLGQSAKNDTEEAVHTVSLLYLDEMADRREQVVDKNLQDRIDDMHTALDLMSRKDLINEAFLSSYQSRMKQLFGLEKFAFVDEDGLIYTSQGTQNDIDEYGFNYRSLKKAEISVKNLDSPDKKVIIAAPVDIRFQGKALVACFMEISMEEMLSGVSLQAQEGGTTYGNIYTSEGIPLSNTVLGGLAAEENLLEALANADFEKGYSAGDVARDFAKGVPGEASFTYDGVQETLSYVPVSGTDWQLTYLIRESVISDQIRAISERTIRRSVLQSMLALLALLAMSIYIIYQVRRNASLMLDQETAAAESRVKQEELERRLELQNQLLEKEKQRSQQDHMITAMASDYRVVYYVDLDNNDGVCYRADPDDREQTPRGVHFSYLERFTWYAEHAVDESYREGFLRFIDPDSIRKGLETEQILAYRYLARRAGREYYEMIRVAGVRHAADRTDHRVHAIGLGLTVIDSEMRKAMAQQQALSDALDAAQQANRAKTVFLSNMSHEIRTPMNAIIGLDNIALKDPELSDRTRDQLEKIGASARHLLGLINDILDMSRIESGRMTIRAEEFSFPEMIGQINTMIHAQCRDKNLDYEYITAGALKDYYIGDALKLKQVLINILGNAVKFTEAPGTVSLAVECAARFEDQSTLRFTIRDTGIGMDKEFLPKVFETFAQENEGTSNKYGSTGLGMAITKNIVELMNGSITVDSEKGAGTTFVVTVPLQGSEHAADEESAMPPADEAADLTGRRILVAEDMEMNADILFDLLEMEGMEHEWAQNGKICVEMFEKSAPRYYDAILMDMRMPVMDGLEAAKAIRTMDRADAKTIPILALTANAFDEDVQRSLQAGMNAHLSKPIESELLYATLGELIRH